MPCSIIAKSAILATRCGPLSGWSSQTQVMQKADDVGGVLREVCHLGTRVTACGVLRPYGIDLLEFALRNTPRRLHISTCHRYGDAFDIHDLECASCMSTGDAPILYNSARTKISGNPCPDGVESRCGHLSQTILSHDESLAEVSEPRPDRPAQNLLTP
jgi:hypothetical protein